MIVKTFSNDGKESGDIEFDIPEFEDGKGPVSYTHLTLPTNREV